MSFRQGQETEKVRFCDALMENIYFISSRHDFEMNEMLNSALHFINRDNSYYEQITGLTSPSRLGVLRCQRETNRDAGSLECVRTFGASQPVGVGRVSVKVKINDFNISPIRWL